MTQAEISNNMAQDGYHVVSCGKCSQVILVDTYNTESQEHEEIIDFKCPHCNWVSDYSDFPDLYV